METLYLKTEDQATMEDILEKAGYGPEVPRVGFLVDIVGVISKPTGEEDEEGGPVYAATPGFHANLHLLSPIPGGSPDEDPEWITAEAFNILVDYMSVPPSNPQRIIA